MKATINGITIEGEPDTILTFCQDIKGFNQSDHWTTAQYALDHLEQAAKEEVTR